MPVKGTQSGAKIQRKSRKCLTMFRQRSPSARSMMLILTESTLFFHDIATRTKTFSGPLDLMTWTKGLAGTHPTRDRSLTFGSGSRNWAFVTPGRPRSHASGPSSSTEITGSMSTISTESQRTSNRGPVAGGHQVEKKNIHDHKLVIGRWDNYAVRGTNSWLFLSS
jgi:hypothetical protein